jgi:hypothetical protein
LTAYGIVFTAIEPEDYCLTKMDFMKKICVIGSALLLLAAGANAQVMGNTSAKTVGSIHLAPEAGINLNNLYKFGKDNYTTSNMLKVGFHGGFAVNIGTGRFAVQPAFRYIQKGGQIEGSYRDALVKIETKNKLTLHYIEMPLNFIYHFGYWGENRFMIGAGPYVSYLANALDKHKTRTVVLETNEDFKDEGQRELPIGSVDNHPENVRKLDAGVGGFLGYQFAGGLYAKAGAQAGLVDLQKRSNILAPYNDRNYNFLFTLGYMLGYKCK